jgi:2-keto-3-deoxy-L-fuconate dehydrogenase
MSDRLKGKRAFVTAASAGIGRACAIAFAREGATVIATDIDEKGLATLAQQGIAETARLDVRNTADVNAFAKRVGTIDVLLNAAGFVHHGTILDCSDEDFDFSFDLNVKSMHRTIKAFLPAMIAGGGGSIVNISSIVGRSGYRGLAVYSATKAALDGFTRAMARELGSRNITVNGIAPGYLRTEMSHGLDDAQLTQIVRRTPAGRLGDPEDVARAAQFLTDPANTYLTGQVLVIDGGLTC